MSVVIRVENLSKQYRLGSIGSGTLKDDLKRWRYSMMGRTDPFLLVGDENNRSVKSSSSYVWALKDINFDISQGDVVGIIGKNGAGKSTLLKILSRTTGPTTGTVKIKGRIASLLEVGTGFHGELTGRENIFLNGAILGMSKFEIKKKFDEIVDFSGVERYIDTPVKRYSSGMYVRLAFAVAAYLDPDILIIDEVLAVGDAEFQSKALGKIKEVNKKEGRTILLVSHNMGTVLQVCPKAIILKNGELENYGTSTELIEKYHNSSIENNYVQTDTNKPIYIKEVFTCDSAGQATNTFSHSSSIHLRITIGINDFNRTQNIGVAMLMTNKARVFTINKSLADIYQYGDSEVTLELTIPGELIAPMNYSFLVALNTRTGLVTYDVQEDICNIKVYDDGTDFAFAEGGNYGCIILKEQWKVIPKVTNRN